MSNIIASTQTAFQQVRPFILAASTCAVEARDRAPWLAANVIPCSTVDERYIQPFTFHALPVHTNTGGTPPLAGATEPPVCPEPLPNVPTLSAVLLQPSARPANAFPLLPVEDLAAAATRAASEAASLAVAEAVETLTRERARLLQSAQEEAARCLAEAQSRTTDLLEAAHQQGLQQGETKAYQEITAQFAPIFSTFQQAVGELSSLRSSVLEQAEADIIALAFQLARKIIAHEVLEHHHVLRTTLVRALAQVADQDRLLIRVHPEDLEQATRLQPELCKALGEVKTVSLQADEGIGRGGCLVETALGTIDARVEAQIAELEQRFRGQHLLDMQARVA